VARFAFGAPLNPLPASVAFFQNPPVNDPQAVRSSQSIELTGGISDATLAGSVPICWLRFRSPQNQRRAVWLDGALPSPRPTAFVFNAESKPIARTPRQPCFLQRKKRCQAESCGNLI
jgi:hypothetical protein